MSLRGTFLKKKGTPRGPFLVQGPIYEKVHFFYENLLFFFAKKCQNATFSKKKGTFLKRDRLKRTNLLTRLIIYNRSVTSEVFFGCGNGRNLSPTFILMRNAVST